MLDKLPDKEAELIDYCLLFGNDTNLQNYNGFGATTDDLLKMTIDDFVNCIFRQQFPF